MLLLHEALNVLQSQTIWECLPSTTKWGWFTFDHPFLPFCLRDLLLCWFYRLTPPLPHVPPRNPLDCNRSAAAQAAQPQWNTRRVQRYCELRQCVCNASKLLYHILHIIYTCSCPHPFTYVQCFYIHYITLDYITFHSIALHYIILHYIPLHCIHVQLCTWKWTWTCVYYLYKSLTMCAVCTLCGYIDRYAITLLNS